MTFDHTVVLLASLLAAAVPASAARHFVAPNGDDANPGTEAQPWQTLAKANATLQPGDTVTFLDGEYPGVIEPTNSGTADAPITYRAANHLGAVITGGESSDAGLVCVRLKECEYILIESFSMLPAAGGWMRLDAANHCIIRRCHMENATRSYSPIRCTKCHYNRYEDLQCLRSNNIGQWGHVAGDMWNNFGCSHNIFERIHISRAGHRPFGMWFDSPHNVVRGCVFDCRWGRNFEFFSSPRNLIEDCVITNGFDGSGSADGRAKLFIVDSIFRRNVVYRKAYGPLVANAYKYHELPTFGIERSRLYNNTLCYNLDCAIQLSDMQPDHRRMIHGNVMQNNIFAFNDPGGDGISLLLADSIATDNRFFCNILYGDKPGCKAVRYYHKYASPSSWEDGAMDATEADEARPKQFRDNMDADPMFVDADADDFRLQASSPAINAGRELTRVSKDARGTVLHVHDARWFYDGFEIPGELGDLISIGDDKQQARVVNADISEDVLTLDRNVTVSRGDRVWLAHLGEAPDLGAYEFGAESREWYSAPKIPGGLRLPTMQTAEQPLVITDFEPENLEQWHYYWNFSRQRNTDSRMDDTTAASGDRSMRVFATADGAIMSCDIRPRWWDIDRFPYVKFSYRIPERVPVGLWLYPFVNTRHGVGAVCVGGTATRATGSYKVVARYELVADGQWHEITIDARVIREVFPDVDIMKMFRFYTAGNGTEGQQYWFDNFMILPAD